MDTGNGAGMDSELPNDDELAARIRDGSFTALETIFSTYYPSLLTYAARQIGSRDAAEDIVQAVFVDVWNRRAQFRPAVTIRVTLFAATRFRLLTYRRSETRREKALSAYAQVATSSMDDDLVSQYPEATQAMAAALAELPDRARETFELRYRQGLSVQETAAVMGVSANTVKTQLARAVGVLRRAAAPFL